MFKNVIFDLDGTLLNTLDDLADACNFVLSTLGFPTHSVEIYKQFVGNGRTKLVERMLPQKSISPALVEKSCQMFDAYYSQHTADKTCVYDGILQLLQTLAKNNIKTAVLTNKPNVFAKEVIHHYFGDLINITQGASNQFPPKPHPGGIHNILHLLGAKAEDCLFVGDSNVDIQTAKTINGLQSCGVLWGFRTKEELLAEGATYIVSHSSQLLDLILK